MRYISALALFSIFAIASFSNLCFVRAQGLLVKPEPPETYIGFRLGTSVASESLLEVRGGASDGLKFGFCGGIDIEHWFNNRWGLATGLLYTQKGVDKQYTQSLTGLSGHGDDNYSMNFIEVPILLKIGQTYGAVRPFFCAGATFGFLTSSSESTNGTLPPVNDPASYLDNFSASLYFGSGATGWIDGWPVFFFDFGYETGLTNVFKSEPAVRSLETPTGQVSATSNEFILTIGLLLRL